MPVGAVDQVRQNQGDEVVVLLAATAHYFKHAEQALYGFLPNDVLAVCQFLDDLRNVPSKSGVAQSPGLVR